MAAVEDSLLLIVEAALGQTSEDLVVADVRNREDKNALRRKIGDILSQKADRIFHMLENIGHDDGIETFFLEVRIPRRRIGHNHPVIEGLGLKSPGGILLDPHQGDIPPARPDPSSHGSRAASDVEDAIRAGRDSVDDLSPFLPIELLGLPDRHLLVDEPLPAFQKAIKRKLPRHDLPGGGSHLLGQPPIAEKCLHMLLQILDALGQEAVDALLHGRAGVSQRHDRHPGGHGLEKGEVVSVFPGFDRRVEKKAMVAHLLLQILKIPGGMRSGYPGIQAQSGVGNPVENLTRQGGSQHQVPLLDKVPDPESPIKRPVIASPFARIDSRQDHRTSESPGLFLRGGDEDRREVAHLGHQFRQRLSVLPGIDGIFSQGNHGVESVVKDHELGDRRLAREQQIAHVVANDGVVLFPGQMAHRSLEVDDPGAPWTGPKLGHPSFVSPLSPLDDVEGDRELAQKGDIPFMPVKRKNAQHGRLLVF